jgi:hypothetical protein
MCLWCCWKVHIVTNKVHGICLKVSKCCLKVRMHRKNELENYMQLKLARSLWLWRKQLLIHCKLDHVTIMLQIWNYSGFYVSSSNFVIGTSRLWRSSTISKGSTTREFNIVGIVKLMPNEGTRTSSNNWLHVKGFCHNKSSYSNHLKHWDLSKDCIWHVTFLIDTIYQIWYWFRVFRLDIGIETAYDPYHNKYMKL